MGEIETSPFKSLEEVTGTCHYPENAIRLPKEQKIVKFKKDQIIEGVAAIKTISSQLRTLNRLNYAFYYFSSKNNSNIE